MVEHNQSSYYNNGYKFNGKELDEATGMYYYGARYYDPRISIFISVDPLAEETMTPYQYCGNNPIMFVDPTGMNHDLIDINKSTGGIKITPAEGKDVVRLVNDGNVESSYVYGEKGSFLKDNKVEKNGLNERIGYKVHFKDASKADKFYKFAAKSDVEFASMNFCFESNGKRQSTVLTNGSPFSVSGTAYAYEVLRNNPDAFLVNFSHSHPGKVDPKTFVPAYPSGFDENLNPTSRSGDRHRYIEGKKEFGNRIPDYFDLFIPQNTNINVKHNGQKVIRTIK